MKLPVSECNANAAALTGFRLTAGIEALTREQTRRGIRKFLWSKKAGQLVATSRVPLGYVTVNRCRRTVRGEDVQVGYAGSLAHQYIFGIADPIRITRRRGYAICKINDRDSHLRIRQSAGRLILRRNRLSDQITTRASLLPFGNRIVDDPGSDPRVSQLLDQVLRGSSKCLSSAGGPDRDIEATRIGYPQYFVRGSIDASDLRHELFAREIQLDGLILAPRLTLKPRIPVAQSHTP